MEEEKAQELHDSLSTLKRSAGLGTSSHFNFGGQLSATKNIRKDGKLIRNDGLPTNALYSNFVKEGSWSKNNHSDASRYGDGRQIKRNFDDCVMEEQRKDSSNKSDKEEMKRKLKEKKKAEKLAAKKREKLEEKRRLKREMKKLESAKSTSSKTKGGSLTEGEAKEPEREKKSEKKKRKKKDDKLINMTKKVDAKNQKLRTEKPKKKVRLEEQNPGVIECRESSENKELKKSKKKRKRDK
mmetsp:Transcript_64/g.89  ORF Transcript_64/g.89 Transcript_64/m.89 type:complete len:240 (+) Transcript_64:111-830(+)|eukprot:CAMPEP_0184865718 /NCGR_PEP_ID=MMETSP0580-20130426/18815_1 /TAXON_ID=1118495 /ORGANISM="Dactyliosolen fragilissimus" /LENGTH=239 /DNA_ID=CAMNT_0027365015 /DNA_START=83 /DNA_END=802 /DNA_ORIENTATION=+